SSSFVPPSALTPPAALIASAAIWAPRRQAWPGSASGPVTGWTTPILNVFAWARSGCGKPTTAAPATVARRNVRRLTRGIVIDGLLIFDRAAVKSMSLADYTWLGGCFGQPEAGRGGGRRARRAAPPRPWATRRRALHRRSA